MIVKCLYDELLPLHKIIEHPKNPNEHFPEKTKILANNIDYQGIRWPIIISKRSGFVVAGHGRLYAARLLEYDQYPVVYQDFDSEAQEYEFLVADNKLAELSETNEFKIKEELKLLPDVKLDMLGFETKLLLLNEDNDTINYINNSDENAEWIEMPEFEKGKDYIRIIIHFNNENDRNDYVINNNINIDKKFKKVWISYQ